MKRQIAAAVRDLQQSDANILFRVVPHAQTAIRRRKSFLPLHLLFPLFSSVVFVLGMMLAKRAIDRGVSPWTGTFLANLWLGLIWAGIAVARGSIVPVAAWSETAVVALLFVFGQVFTYLAFQFGDVSVAAPILGLKVLIVATLSSLLAGEVVAGRVWIAGALAAAGVIAIQLSNRSATPDAKQGRTGLTILLAIGAATSLSLFDVGMQKWGPKWDSFSFLPVMFVMTVLLSVVFLPKVDSPAQLKKLGVRKWILGGTTLMAVQAMSMCYVLSTYGDATRVNIVYSLRGLWGVILAWLLARSMQSAEAGLPRGVMLSRLGGATLLTAAVLLAITA